MIKEVTLASSSGVRLKILEDNNFNVKQLSPGVDEDEVKISLINNGATCLQIAKNLAELKANRISAKFPGDVVIGADQVMDFQGKNFSKPKDKSEAKSILKILNNKKHYLHSAVCVSRAGSMISNFHESCPLKVKNLTDKGYNISLKIVGDGMHCMKAYDTQVSEAVMRRIMSKK